MNQKHWISIFAALAVLSFSKPSLAVDETAEVNAEMLRNGIKQFLTTQVNQKYQGRADIRISRLDNQYGFKSCASELEYKLPKYSRLGSRTTVTVNCYHPHPWSLTIPASVRVYREVATLARPLSRGEKITPAAVKMQEANILTLNQGYFDNIGGLPGMITTKPLRVGTILTSQHITPPDVVKRNEMISIFTRRNGILVISKGQALEDGQLGETIRVRNTSSKRVVQGIVAGAQEVEIR